MARRAASLARACLLGFLLDSAAAHAAVHPLFGLDHPTSGPFPSDRFTVPDDSQLTGLRVNLPRPDCAVRVSDCDDIALLNEIDGFNVQPRLSIPFSGPIDVNSVSSDSVFLVGPAGQRVGINQVVWDVATNTLHVESDELLEQHTTYVLVVTRDVRDTAGMPIEAAEAFMRFRHDLNFGQTKDEGLKAYRKALLEGLARASEAGARGRDIAVASVFTTQSVTAILEKIRDQIKAATPAAADFRLGPGEARTVFPLGAVTGITLRQQVSTAPTFNPPVALAGRLVALRIFPGAVGQIAFGKYFSPQYITVRGWIPAVATRAGAPAVQSTQALFFNLYLPSGPTPPAGWPVAIYGHGGAEDKNGTSFNIASTMAAHGIATLTLTGVGRGFGPLGTLTVSLTSGGPVTFPAGGRGTDLNGDGIFADNEGTAPAPPPTNYLGRDTFTQTVADLMQLIRVIDVGLDVDDDGARDLDPSRVYYVGFSFGGNVGTILMAVEPSVRAAVLNSPGGSVESRRLSPINRPSVGRFLASRVPSLINVVDPSGIAFDENVPLRNQPAVTNTVPGAMEIQHVLENTEWAGGPLGYAPHLRRRPLDGVPPRPVIVLFAKGDRTAPNPAATALLRAGDLAHRATYLRYDLLFAANPSVPNDPHNFLITTGNTTGNPSRAQVSLAAQEQVAVFFASDGAVTIDPDGAGPLFETPIAGPLPEEPNFLP